MYVVAGVSGNTGKVVADALLNAKKAVRVVVRDASKGEPWRARGAEVAEFELDNVDALTGALRGADGAYLLLPPMFGTSDSRGDNAKRIRGFVEAINASGVPHVVFLSSIGAQHPTGTGPIVSLHDAESALRKSRAKLTFVRAAYFMENWGGSLYALDSGALPSFLKADASIPMVATGDIGAVAAKALIDGAAEASVIELAGPREYSPRDVAAALSQVTGKPIAVAEAPESAMIGALTGAGLNAHWAALFQEMTHGVNTNHVAWERGAARAVRGAIEADAVLKKLVSGS